MRAPAPAIFFGPISTSARGGGASISPQYARPSLARAARLKRCHAVQEMNMSTLDTQPNLAAPDDFYLLLVGLMKRNPYWNPWWYRTSAMIFNGAGVFRELKYQLHDLIDLHIAISGQDAQIK